MSGSEDFDHKIGVQKVNLADMAEHLEPNERQKVAERTSGEYYLPTISPAEYLAVTENYEKKDESFIQRVLGRFSTDRIEERRESAEQLISEETNPEDFMFGYDGELPEEDVLDTLEKYENSEENPYQLNFDDYRVFKAIRRKAWDPNHNSEERQDKLYFKQFPGLGTFKYIDSGVCREVYRGPVEGENDRVVYIPNEISAPDAYEDNFGNMMAQATAAVQNKRSIEESEIDAEFVSETFEPLIVNLHGEAVPIILADYREMEEIPYHKKEEACGVAEKLQEESENGNLIYYGNIEFLTGGSIEKDNLKHDPNTGELVVADAGEFHFDLNREDIEQLLTEDMNELMNNQRTRVS